MGQPVSVTAPKCPLCQGPDTMKVNGHRAMCHQCSKSYDIYCFCEACQLERLKSAEADASCRPARCALRAVLLSEECITDPSSPVKGCPFFRACPKCNTLVTYNGGLCPNVICPGCSAAFCFRCVRQVYCPSMGCTIVDNSRSLEALGL